jgi:hypothetical protein
MNSSYEESSSSDEEEEHKYRRHGKSSEDEDEDEEEESSSDSDDEEEDEEEDSDDSTSSEELKRRAKKKNKDKGKEKGKETLGRTAMKRAAMEEGERVGSIPHAADTSPSIARAVMSPRLSGGSSGGGIDRTSSGNIRQRPPLTGAPLSSFLDLILASLFQLQVNHLPSIGSNGFTFVRTCRCIF